MEPPYPAVTVGAEPFSPASAADYSPAAAPDRSVAVQRMAWKRPSNGAVTDSPPPVAASAADAVIDADSWPALSESAAAKVPMKPSPSLDSIKVSPDGSAEGSVIVPAADHPKQNAAGGVASLNSPTASSVGSPRSKSRRSGGSGGGGQPLSPASSPRKVADKSLNAIEHSTRDNTNNWDHSGRGSGKPSQSHGGGSNQRVHNGSRRGGNNSGGGYNGRRNQGKGEYHGPMGRDPHGSQAVATVGIQPAFIHLPTSPSPPPPPPPIVTPPYMAAPQVRPFSGHIFYHDISPHFPPIYYVPPPPPYVAPTSPPPYMYPQSDPCSELQRQIEYYFSSDNLCKDTFLRENMDDQGWVPISLIANFNKVKKITNSIAFIIETLRISTVVEVQGEKIRKRDDWGTWVLPGRSDVSTASSAAISHLTASIQSVALDGSTIDSLKGETQRGDQ